MRPVSHAKTRTAAPSVHERLLAAAARVFACYGAAGATTRRIAAEARVNEVTLFRHFGSKEALLDAAVQASVQHVPTASLPDTPDNPHGELTAWCETEMQRLGGAGGLLQHCFAEAAVRPEQGMTAGDVILELHEVLIRYVAALARSGCTIKSESVKPAVAMLVSVLVSDALGREQMDRMFPSRDASAESYTRAFLTLIGVSERHRLAG